MIFIRPPGTVVPGRPYVLPQFIFFHREIFEVRGPISAKFCHIVGNMLDLQYRSKNLGACPLLQRNGGKHAKFGPILDPFPI